MRKRHAVTTAEILEKVKDHVAPLPSQEGYMKSLAVLLAMHMNRNRLIDDGYAPDDLPVPSAIVVAPTGQGKTFLLRKMVKMLHLNLITVDCSTLVGENYKGVSLSQRIAGAMEEAKDEKSFQQSVLFLDETDKLCRGNSQHSSGMTAFLQLFNGGSITISKDDRKAESVDVSRFLIILAGAFVGLEEIVRARLCPRPKIGFDAGTAVRKTEIDYLQEVTADDLEKFGLMRELLGRVGTILVLPPLGLEDYKVLLNAEAGSVGEKYKTYLLELYGAQFAISEAATEYLAQKSFQSSAGARAVFPLMNDLMRSVVERVEEGGIRGVALDVEDDSVVIRYDYGEPAELEVQKKDTSGEMPWHTIRAKNTDALVRKLCRYCRNAGANSNILEQLEVFLSCAISYLYHTCREEDFEFASLEKLAKVTRREGSSSTFEMMMHRSFYVSPGAYQRLREKYNVWMVRNVISGLEYISGYLLSRHGTNRIRFKITKKQVER